jgi:hypothetical protein
MVAKVATVAGRNHRNRGPGLFKNTAIARFLVQVFLILLILLILSNKPILSNARHPNFRFIPKFQRLTMTMAIKLPTPCTDGCGLGKTLPRSPSKIVSSGSFHFVPFNFR